MTQKLDTSYHERRKAKLMKNPEFRAEYERTLAEINQVDSIINALDEIRETQGVSKAELARSLGKNPSSIRRLFTAKSNPQLTLLASIANNLNAEIKVVPRT